MVQAKGVPNGKEWEAVASYLPGELTAKATSDRWRRLHESITQKGLLNGDENEEDAAGPVKEAPEKAKAKAAPKKAAAKPKPGKKVTKAVEERDEEGGASAVAMFSKEEGAELAAADEHEREHFEVESPDEEMKKTTARKTKDKNQVQATRLVSSDENGNDEVQVANSPTPGPEKRRSRRLKALVGKVKGTGKAIVAKKTWLTAEDSGVEDVDQESEDGEVIADTPPASSGRRSKFRSPPSLF